MRNKFFIMSILLLAFCTAFTLAREWKLDTENTYVSFELPAHQKKGTFANLKASIHFDKRHLDEAKINASIDVKTINVGNQKHEEHLLSADFFDAEKFPTISFSSTEVIKSGDAYIAKGKLTMKDSTRLVELPFTFTEQGKDKGVFNGTLTVFASDYGLIRGARDKTETIVNLVVPVRE